MQAGVILHRAPIPSEKRLPADEVQRPRHRAAIALRQHQRDVIAQTFLRQIEKLPRQVGRAPFARPGVLIKAPESIPMPGLDLFPREGHDLPPESDGLGALLADVFAFARTQR